METGTLRRIPFKEIYEQIVSRLGLDPSLPVPHNLWQAIPRNINKRLRTAWTYWEWPYLEQCDERAFARTWLHDHQFAAGEMVIYLVDLKYYRAKGDLGDTPPLIGAPPTNATYWDPVTDYGNFIAFDQICRRPLGMVLGVYKGDPRSNGCGCGHSGMGYRPQQNGIAVCGGSGPTVFVKYQLPVPRFSLMPYAPGRIYQVGKLVYHSSSGECYIAVALSQNEPPPNGLFWLRQEFPAVFEDYVVAATYASCLKEVDQSQVDPNQQQMRMMWARDAEAEAEEKLVEEIDKLKAMGQRFHYRAWKETCYHAHAPGVCTSEPFTGDTPGFEPPVTTLKEICETDPTAYPPPGPDVPPGEGPGIELVNGVTQLVADQAYIDVTFLVPQENASWIFVECHVVNTTDETPLNIWPGILTNKTAAGFTIQLNGTPDTANYYLHWAVTGGTVPPPAVATTYSLSGPSSGLVSVPSANFTVALPGGGTVPAPVTVTPDDGGAGGTFTPASVSLSTAAPAATFKYTPASTGVKTISLTNDGGLTDPASRTYTSNVNTAATTYTLTGPTGGTVSVASTNFTVALPGGSTVAAPVTVTPSAGGGGGTFTPATVNLTTAAPAATFTYTPASAGAKTISVTNSGGLTNPASLSYVVTLPAVAFLDDFNGSGTLYYNIADSGEEWFGGTGTTKISSGSVYGSSAGGDEVHVHHTPLTADHEASITIIKGAITGLPEVGIWLRGSGAVSARNGYLGRFLEGSGWQFYRMNTGGYTQVGVNTAGTLANGDVIRFTVAGTGATVTLTLYKNGVLQYQTTDSSGSRLVGNGEIGIHIYDPSNGAGNYRIDKMTTPGTPPATEFPLTIAGLKLWLKADAITGPPADGATVDVWRDQSRSGNYFAQFGGPQQPLFKTNRINSLPALKFDGSDDNMAATIPGGVTTEVSVFIVQRKNANSGTLALHTSVTSATNSFAVYLPFSDNVVYFDLGDTTGTGRISSAWGGNYTDFFVWSFVAGGGGGGNMAIYRNGTTVVSSGSHANSFNPAGLILLLNGTGAVGGSQDADIAEILIYNNALGTTDRQNVENYLLAKYGL